jgi:hypothetical protein
METMAHLIFPLAWQGTFVSQLPSSLVGLTDAPGGFLIGVCVPENENALELCRDLGIPEDVYIVSLDDRVGFELHPELRKRLPKIAFATLERHISFVLDCAGVNPGKESLRYMDSAFEFSVPPNMTASKKPSWPPERVRDHIRDSFLRFMVVLLHDFRHYFCSPIHLPGASSGIHAELLFDKEHFINDASTIHRPLLEAVCDTQMFSVMITRHIADFGHDHRMAFFDACTAEAQSTLKYTDQGCPLEESVNKRVVTKISKSRKTIDFRIPHDIQDDLFGILAAKSSSAPSTVVINGPMFLSQLTPSPVFFTYQTWPKLNPALLVLPSSAIPTEVHDLGSQNAQGLLQGSIMSLIRSPFDRTLANHYSDLDFSSLYVVEIYNVVLLATPTLGKI